MTGKTLYDKLWQMHEVTRRDDGSSLIYICTKSPRRKPLKGCVWPVANLGE